MSSVEIARLEKSFGSAAVLHAIELVIADGEFVCLVGPSGCGKSTLLRLIAGLEQITSGTVKIGPRVVNNVRPKDRNIAMVFQSYALYPHMTVAQNMGFAMEIAGLPRAEVRAKVLAAAEILDLSGLLDRMPRALSGGQRQRVAMGRAIVRDPEVFLFDEPLSNLDAKLRVQMRAEIKALHQRLKTTSIYVTHDQVEAMTMADRIVVMNSGRVEQIGRPLDLYDRPDTLFVATFLGSPAMNLLPGRVEDARFVSEGGPSFALNPALAQVAAGRPLIAGIRPEHVMLAAPGTAALQTTVILDEPTGVDTQIALRLGTYELNMTARDRLAVTPGQTMEVAFPPDRIHLFDAGSKARIAHPSEVRTGASR